MFRKYFLLFLPALIFLVIGALTLGDYGTNWDEPYHFMRGQAYLHFFLTGQKDYKSIPQYPRLNPKCSEKLSGSDCDISPAGAWDVVRSPKKAGIYEAEIKSQYTSDYWRSIFQHDIYTYEYFLKNDEGHPPLADIASAFFNYIFYNKLKIIGDLESYHLFEIFISTLLVGGVYLIAKKELGIFPAIVAAFALGSYPLFFSESHFNIKDPVETSFYGLTLILFYLGIAKLEWRYILVSAFFAGWALGTKFNIFFAALIVVPWLILHLAIHFLKKRKFQINKSSIRKLMPLGMALVAFLPIAFGILYILWPFLWDDPIARFEKILSFYRQIGVGIPGEMASYVVKRWNTYPIIWIIVTTPLPILVLTIFGILGSLFLALRGKRSFGLFAILWFLIPVLRASFPGAGIYGGVRQLMEYIPGMAILAGIGVYYLKKSLPQFGNVINVLVILGLIFVGYEMIKIHPNQNVYFNQLIGGLSGAKEKNIPYWGNTYGNVYLQGINWLNENAEPNAKLGLPIATMGNVPRQKLRSDIDFWNGNWSGPKRAGEYEMEMDFEWPPKYWYSFQYYDAFLEPVYVASVDGVPLLKVWKNDLEHTKPDFREEINYQPVSTKFRKNSLNTEVWFDFGKSIYLTSLKINHATKSCLEQKSGYIATSLDDKNWKREADPINTPQVPVTATGWDEDTFVFLFPGRYARYLILDPQMENSCLVTNPQIEIKVLKKSALIKI